MNSRSKHTVPASQPTNEPIAWKDLPKYIRTQFGRSEPTLNTLHRWRIAGVRGKRLESYMIGGRRFVRPSAIQAFFNAVTAAAA